MSFAGAYAVDLGATSARRAKGWIEDGRIRFEVTKQVPHQPRNSNGRIVWDIDFLAGFCRESVAEAKEVFGTATIGIDTWGVDHGFIGHDGNLLQEVVAYRDLSHQAAFERNRAHHSMLYRLTGIQHQPFNTVHQLSARSHEDPALPERTRSVLVLPDLLGYLISGNEDFELTEWSTSQMMGIDGRWCREAFQLAGFRPPESDPQLPGRLLGEIEPNIRLARVGGHDTASAVCGLGTLADDQAFLNVGTWSLLGTVVDRPIATPEAEAANLTNERTVDGRVRLLANIPGFYVINRLHDELEVGVPVPVWLSRADLNLKDRVDLLRPEFFNPASMVEALCDGLTARPQDDAQWAGLALLSLASTAKRQLANLETITGRRFTSIRAAGGGSGSAAFCQALANACQVPVLAGPAEATVLGNLGVQFLAQGVVPSFPELARLIERSIELKETVPNA